MAPELDLPVSYFSYTAGQLNLPNRTTTLPTTALGKATSTLSVRLAFLPLSRSLLACMAKSEACFGTGKESTWANHRDRWGRPGFLMDPAAELLASHRHSSVVVIRAGDAQRMEPQIIQSPSPNLWPAKYVLSRISLLIHSTGEHRQTSPVG